MHGLPSCGRGAGLLACAAENSAARRGGNRHDVTGPGRRGLRPASGRAASDEPVALHERLLARSGDDARHDRPDLAILSDQFTDLGPTGLAGGAAYTRLKL